LTNYLCTVHLAALAEALTVAKVSGLDLNTTYEGIRISSGNSFVHETESQVILNGSRDINFTMDLVIKDVGLFDELARAHGVPLELSPLVLGVFRDGARRYGERELSPNIIRRLEEACGVRVLVAGFLLGTFFMAFHSTQAPQLGLPQMIQSRPQFGYSGALLVWGVAMIAYVGYNAFNQVLAAQALHQLNGSISPTSPTAIVLIALGAVALAALGYDKIHAAQRGFAYLMIVILTVFSVGALFTLSFPAVQWDPAGFRGVPFLAQLFAAASYQLSWSIYVSDYSRYLPRDVGVRASFWWTYLGAFVGGAWMMLVGTVAAAAAPKLDVAAAMEHAADAVLPGLSRVLLVGALLGLVAISALNFYGASLTLLSCADTVKPLRCTAGKRLVSLAVAFVASNAIAL